MTWHVEPKLIAAYAGGHTDEAHAYSIEAHMLECATCRELLGAHVDHGRLQAVWGRVLDALMVPQPGVVERTLLRLGVSDYVARLLTATPSLHLSWFAGISLVLAFAVGAAYLSSAGFVLFLILAPLLPLAGIAAAYGPGVDPTYEIGLVAPMRSFHLLMIRASAVLFTSGGIGLVAALALPQRNWALVAWLVPSLALSSVSLALSTVIPPLRSAVMVAGLWIVGCGLGAVSASRSTATLEGIFGGVLQLVLATLTVIAVATIVHRRETFEGGAR